MTTTFNMGQNLPKINNYYMGLVAILSLDAVECGMKWNGMELWNDSGDILGMLECKK